MSDVRSCGQCGATLPADSPHGVCPSCLMRVGLGAVNATGTRSAQGQLFVPPKPGELSVHFPQLEILDLIGQGGMGAVYKARQVGLDRIVALKILPPHAGDDGSFASRFEREARSLARLSHPHIIGVFDSGQAGDFYYFVMEFVDGVNLREAIAAGALTPSQSLNIVPQLCDALQYAHDEGIVHRDIKPENVLIDTKGNTKIADFGLARLLGPTTDVTLTGTHQVMGTPRYMAPEQMEGSHEVDHRADIYSLGVVFYEMLTGELPLGRFDGPSKKAQVDARLDDVVFRTLEKEPDRRYQHASEIKDDVQTICAPGSRLSYQYKSKTDADLPPKMVPADLQPNPRRSNWGLVMAVVLIGGFVCMCALPILGLGVTYFYLQSMPAGPQVTRLPNARSVPTSTVELRSHVQQSGQGMSHEGMDEGMLDDNGWIVWTENGPTIKSDFGTLENPPLTAEQLARVNQILAETHQAYVKIEQENMDQRRSDAGHWVTTVNIKDADALEEVENQLWTQIDAAVGISWQRLLRSFLRLKRYHDVGILGFQGHQGAIEIWKVGSWYHWKVTSHTQRSAGGLGGLGSSGPGFEMSHQIAQGPESSGPQLPVRYRRFWKESDGVADH